MKSKFLEKVQANIYFEKKHFLRTLGFTLLFILFTTLPDYNKSKGRFFSDFITYESTSGTIIESKIHSTFYKFDWEYSYSIKYSYKVNNINFESDQVDFFHGYGTKNGVIAKTNYQYPVGKSVAVYYEKANPSFSVLEKWDDSTNNNNVLIGMWLIIFLLIYFLYLPTIKKKKTLAEVKKRQKKKLRAGRRKR
ncbi:MAG: DUF3592 domain-containing protein [Campylobacteraceae bacterium]|nr:DUF3592 domain-containing protein [Campylobacteraceae bacterium]